MGNCSAAACCGNENNGTEIDTKSPVSTNHI
jgi:hypothetical protein